MLKNHCIIAIRHIRRHLVYTSINIVGLAVGLATCLVIGLFVWHKLSYDRFFPRAERTYRIVQTREDGFFARIPPGLAKWAYARWSGRVGGN